MSRQNVLEAIGRAERIADRMVDANERELNSLGGQAVGSVRAAVTMLEAAGVNVQNDQLNALSRKYNNSASEVCYYIHQCCAYLRGLASTM